MEILLGPRPTQQRANEFKRSLDNYSGAYMGRTAARVERRRESIRDKINQWLDMIVDEGRSSKFRFSLEEYEEAGRAAREQQMIENAVPKPTVELRRDITAPALEATLDLVEGFEEGHPDLEEFIRRGRTVGRRA